MDRVALTNSPGVREPLAVEGVFYGGLVNRRFVGGYGYELPTSQVIKKLFHLLVSLLMREASMGGNLLDIELFGFTVTDDNPGKPSVAES